MAVYALTIDGTPRKPRAGSLTISKTANGRSTASFSIVSEDGSYRAADLDEVIMTDGATRIFGGLVDRPAEKGAVPNSGASPAIVTTVSAVDFNAYADWRYVNGTFAAGTLKSFLTALVSGYLATEYGVSLHGSQVDGPAIPEMTFVYRKMSDVLNDLVQLTAGAGQPYVWRIDYFKVLRMYQPSTTAAPFDIVDNVPAGVIGDLTVETSRENYANRVIVKVPEKTEIAHNETFAGDNVTTTFQLQFSVLKSPGIIHTPVQGGGETFGLAADGAMWTYDPVLNTITRNVGASVSGQNYSLTYDGKYAGLGLAEDAGEIAANGLREAVVVVDSVPADSTAQAIAEAELAIRIPIIKKIRYTTHTSGFEPGQQQSVTMTRRNLSVTAVITDVVTNDYGKDILRHNITAVVDAAQTNLGRGWRDKYKQWSGDKAGNAANITTATPTTPPSSGAGLPATAVQFNRAGSFGGDAAFTYNEDGNNLVMGGGGSSITATDAESCVVFGYDCHITDP